MATTIKAKQAIEPSYKHCLLRFYTSMPSANLLPIFASIVAVIVVLTAGYQSLPFHFWVPTIIAARVPVGCTNPSLVLFGAFFIAYKPEGSTIKLTYATSILSGGALTRKLISGDTKYY